MKDTPDTGSSFEIQRLVGRYAVPTDPYTQLSLTDPCRTEHGARRWREIEEWQRAPVGWRLRSFARVLTQPQDRIGTREWRSRNPPFQKKRVFDCPKQPVVTSNPCNSWRYSLPDSWDLAKHSLFSSSIGRARKTQNMMKDIFKENGALVLAEGVGSANDDWLLCRRPLRRGYIKRISIVRTIRRK